MLGTAFAPVPVIAMEITLSLLSVPQEQTILTASRATGVEGTVNAEAGLDLAIRRVTSNSDFASVLALLFPTAPTGEEGKLGGLQELSEYNSTVHNNLPLPRSEGEAFAFLPTSAPALTTLSLPPALSAAVVLAHESVNESHDKTKDHELFFLSGHSENQDPTNTAFFSPTGEGPRRDNSPREKPRPSTIVALSGSIRASTPKDRTAVQEGETFFFLSPEEQDGEPVIPDEPDESEKRGELLLTSPRSDQNPEATLLQQPVAQTVLSEAVTGPQLAVGNFFPESSPQAPHPHIGDASAVVARHVFQLASVPPLHPDSVAIPSMTKNPARQGPVQDPHPRTAGTPAVDATRPPQEPIRPTSHSDPAAILLLAPETLSQPVIAYAPRLDTRTTLSLSTEYSFRESGIKPSPLGVDNTPVGVARRSVQTALVPVSRPDTEIASLPGSTESFQKSTEPPSQLVTISAPRQNAVTTQPLKTKASSSESGEQTPHLGDTSVEVVNRTAQVTPEHTPPPEKQVINFSEGTAIGSSGFRQAQPERITSNVARPLSVHPELFEVAQDRLVEGQLEGFSTASSSESTAPSLFSTGPSSQPVSVVYTPRQNAVTIRPLETEVSPSKSKEQTPHRRDISVGIVNRTVQTVPEPTPQSESIATPPLGTATLPQPVTAQVFRPESADTFLSTSENRSVRITGQDLRPEPVDAPRVGINSLSLVTSETEQTSSLHVTQVEEQPSSSSSGRDINTGNLQYVSTNSTEIPRPPRVPITPQIVRLVDNDYEQMPLQSAQPVNDGLREKLLMNSSEPVSPDIPVLRQAQPERTILNVVQTPAVRPEPLSMWLRTGLDVVQDRFAQRQTVNFSTTPGDSRTQHLHGETSTPLLTITPHVEGVAPLVTSLELIRYRSPENVEQPISITRSEQSERRPDPIPATLPSVVSLRSAPQAEIQEGQNVRFTPPSQSSPAEMGKDSGSLLMPSLQVLSVNETGPLTPYVLTPDVVIFPSRLAEKDNATLRQLSETPLSVERSDDIRLARPLANKGEEEQEGVHLSDNESAPKVNTEREATLRSPLTNTHVPAFDGAALRRTRLQGDVASRITDAAGVPSHGETAGIVPLPASPLQFHITAGPLIIERVAQEIVAHINQDQTKAVIEVEPQELGRIQIDLVVEGEKVQVRIVTEAAEVSSLLQSHVLELKQALQHHNLELSTVSVDVSAGGRDQGNLASGSQQHPLRQDSGSTEVPRSPAEEGEPDPQRPNSPPQSQSSVNVWA